MLVKMKVDKSILHVLSSHYKSFCHVQHIIIWRQNRLSFEIFLTSMLYVVMEMSKNYQNSLPSPINYMNDKLSYY